MKMSHTRVLVLHDSPTLHSELKNLPRKDFQYDALTGWGELIEALRESSASVIPVVDPYFGQTGDRPATELRSLLIDFPSIAVAAALWVGPDRLADLRTFGNWGVAEVFSLGHDDTTAAMMHRLAQMRGQKLKQLVEPLLSPQTSGRARAILNAAAEIVVAGGTARELAVRLSLSRRTLLRWTAIAGLPAPRKLLAWMRILLAAELLDDRGRTVHEAARAAGYSSDAGLRRITHRFVGLSPTEMRTRGAFAAAAKPFRAALSEAQASFSEAEVGHSSERARRRRKRPLTRTTSQSGGGAIRRHEGSRREGSAHPDRNPDDGTS